MNPDNLEQYLAVHFKATKGSNEILIALLSSINFDSFEEFSENHLCGYILEKDFDEQRLSEVLATIPALAKLKYRVSILQKKNWNETWEKGFTPVVIDEICTIRAPFHKKATTKYVITIEPKMAFGTGHHATTAMMISLMLKMDFDTANVLDFGCGTAILSVLASKLKSFSIFGNDIEAIAVENANEIIKLNNCNNISLEEGGIEIVPNTKYDIILANVNAAAINQNLKHLKSKLKKGGTILLSGILLEQEEQIIELSKTLNFSILESRKQGNWVALKGSH